MRKGMGAPTGSVCPEVGRVDANRLQVLSEVDAGQEQHAWDRGSAFPGAGCRVSHPRVQSLTHGVMCQPNHVVTNARGHRRTWSLTQGVNNLRGHAVTCPHD